MAPFRTFLRFHHPSSSTLPNRCFLVANLPRQAANPRTFHQGWDFLQSGEPTPSFERNRTSTSFLLTARRPYRDLLVLPVEDYLPKDRRSRRKESRRDSPTREDRMATRLLHCIRKARTPKERAWKALRSCSSKMTIPWAVRG